MASTNLKRYAIPTLDEMENADTEKEPERLFKRQKELSSQCHSTRSTTISTDNSSGLYSSKATNNADLARSTANQNPTRSPEFISSNILSKSSVSSAVTKIQDSDNLKKNSSDLDLDSPSKKGTDSLKPDSSNGSDNTVQGPPIASRPGSSNSLIVNTRQRGNPILKSVRNTPWEYGNIVPDYVMGQSNCALYLSLRYHQLHPNYIHDRLKLLGKSYDLRVMLVQVDVKEPHHMLKDLAKICLLADCTLILAFSPEEAGRYLETYKIFENKPPEAIMERTEENFMAKFTDCLTRVKSVNRTDCATLISHFGTLTNVMEAAQEDLSLCPGFGPQKAKRLHSIFHEPFLRSGTIDKHN